MYMLDDDELIYKEERTMMKHIKLESLGHAISRDKQVDDAESHADAQERTEQEMRDEGYVNESDIVEIYDNDGFYEWIKLRSGDKFIDGENQPFNAWGKDLVTYIEARRREFFEKQEWVLWDEYFDLMDDWTFDFEKELPDFWSISVMLQDDWHEGWGLGSAAIKTVQWWIIRQLTDRLQAYEYLNRARVCFVPLELVRLDSKAEFERFCEMFDNDDVMAISEMEADIREDIEEVWAEAEKLLFEDTEEDASEPSECPIWDYHFDWEKELE